MYHIGLSEKDSDGFDADAYANADFSNISAAVYKYKNRSTLKDLSGFDYVKTYVKKYFNYDSEISGYVENRWFRLWNSGYLEHGGIVKTARGLGVNEMDIVFEWEYGKGADTKNSPVYNYSNLSKSNMYSVSVSPIYKRYKVVDGAVVPVDITYPTPVHNELSNYIINSVHPDKFTNYGFTMTVDNRYYGTIEEEQAYDLHAMTPPYIEYYATGYII